MIGKMIGAIAGKQVSKHVSGLGGTGGAILGMGAATVLRRLGPAGLVAAAVGSYAIKKRMDKKAAVKPDGQPR